MVDRNLINSLNISDAEIEQQLQSLGADFNQESLGEMIQEKTSHQTGTILIGHVVGIIGNDVVVEVGLKSEGTVDISEFDDPSAIELGQEVEVFLEEVESDSGLVVLSKRKADRIRGWEWIVQNKKEGDVVTGPVTRKIKGGLLMDIGVPAFLPASQVDIRRPHDIGEYIGRRIDAKILKIDQDRRNIVVSRRKLIEEERAEAKEKLLAGIEEGQIRKGVVKNLADFGAFVDLGGIDGLLHITDISWGRIGHPSEVVQIDQELEVGQMRKGIVKNIADFGAFVDLGGVDGLLHITDMSWGRVSHPSEVVALDQEIEVKILNVDHQHERIALGLKQKQASPWEQVGTKYPVGAQIRGEVVNIVNYGAFVKIEEGIEGLVHISEMSWTRRINHPSEVVAIGDIIDVVVLDINKDKQEISLGMRQTEVNPWTLVKEKYPAGTVIEGRVRNLTIYGAFIEI